MKRNQAIFRHSNNPLAAGVCELNIVSMGFARANQPVADADGRFDIFCRQCDN
ncbi:MAG: hypothetical protein GQF41_0932 [Candidatus Rifleibacterium amylolyticum]|nr:MAG: hypothetical protein GQF41_0932 [Candidatus Rifleibacterium amylolyticum]